MHHWPMIRVPAYLLLLATLVPGVALAGPTRFRFPAVDPDGVHFMKVPIVGVDHDPAVDPTGTTCVNYNGDGLPWCYDGHEGTDYLLMWGFSTMDQHDVQVVAAADGEVTQAEDGNYDRCHETSGFVVTCDGHPMKANQVAVRHADGLLSRYAHLKKGSVKVKVGQKVRCGDLLGYVGSSGRSARPHLHFEVQDAAGKAVDPYAGIKSQATSYWVDQTPDAHGKPAARCQGAGGGDGGPGEPGEPPLGWGCHVGNSDAGLLPFPLLLLLGWIAFLRVRH